MGKTLKDVLREKALKKLKKPRFRKAQNEHKKNLVFDWEEEFRKAGIGIKKKDASPPDPCFNGVFPDGEALTKKTYDKP